MGIIFVVNNQGDVSVDLAAVGGSNSSCIYLDADDDHSEVSLPEPSLHIIAQELSSIAGGGTRFFLTS